MLDEEKRAIQLACLRGDFHTWSPTHDLRVTRLTNGRVQLYFPDRNGAVYRTVLAYAKELVNEGVAHDLQDGPREGPWTFSFMPVRK